MAPDYGSAHDGTCEFSFFERCTQDAETTVAYGQFGGWRYRYCGRHAESVLASYDDAHVLDE